MRKRISDVLKEGQKALIEAGIEEYSLDAWYLLEWVTVVSRAQYYAYPEKELTAEQEDCYEKCIRKRCRHIPLQHITGEQEFMGLIFKVNEHVLIPRQDTEVLVETGLEKLKPGMKVLDMCTGSGCIIISLEKYCRQMTDSCLQGEENVETQMQFTGADISLEALEKAQENVELHHSSVKLIQSDLFENIVGKYDIILSNPPYIKTAVIEQLQEEVRRHDPYIALDGKEDGLHFYRKIITESRIHLKAGGWLLFEIGHDQKEAVIALMETSGYKEIFAKKDLAGLDRVVGGRYIKE